MLRSGPPDKIIDMVGEGTFGKVLSCWDRTARRMVAIKVVRDIKKYQEAAEIEIDVLKRLARHDPTNTRCIHTLARRLQGVLTPSYAIFDRPADASNSNVPS